MTNSEATDPATIRRVTNAARAIAIYELVTFPGQPSNLSGDSEDAKALLGSLLCDLEHYADALGIDFTEAAKAGRAAHADEIAETQRFHPGDEVKLRRPGGACGTITGFQCEPGDEPTFIVEIPGRAYLLMEQSVHLEPAPPFPTVTTRLGEVMRADQADKMLLKLAIRSPRTGADAITRQECGKLLDALSSWSGTPRHQLLAVLGPGLADRIATEPWADTTSQGARANIHNNDVAAALSPSTNDSTKTSSRLAALDFPHDIAEVVSSSPKPDALPRLHATENRAPSRAITTSQHA
ncbi:hypothetical protein ACGFNU_44170 [Spirillospora sp. NPDC048911]|uniref:hypothetical protein n=1 Tax=Spirillospora sp. NPDC048911 TaxID=3364527 RepID=UPI003721CD0F